MPAQKFNTGLTTRTSASREELERKLLAGRAAQRSIRCSVSGTLLTFGLLSGALDVFHDSPSVSEGFSPGSCTVSGLVWFSAVLSLNALSWAPLPDDATLTRVVAVVSLSLAGLLAYAAAANRADAESWQADEALWTAILVIYSCCLLITLTLRGPRRLQRGLQLSLQVLFGLSNVMHAILLAMKGFENCEPWYLACDLFGLLLCSMPGLRQRVHRWLTGLFDMRNAKIAAAGIAGLIGSCPVKEVVSQATARFRCIQCDQVAAEDFVTQDSNPELNLRAVPTRLGACDAFISHSWSDDGQSKWEALQQWCDSFVAAHGRQPTIWLDKFCVDQTDIEADLRCLPVFLGGCKEVVVLCGPTYFSRLWCVMELFTHHHMRRSNSSLTVIPALPKGEGLDAGLEGLAKALDEFDVEKCQCSCPEDREQMMRIIQVAFGTTSAFNKVVREIFEGDGVSEICACQWASDCESQEERGPDAVACGEEAA